VYARRYGRPRITASANGASERPERGEGAVEREVEVPHSDGPTDSASQAATGPLASDEVSCPKCGGRTWDNRLTKRNPKAPDYKCRDRSCDGVIWPPKAAKVEKGAAEETEEIPF
jgi:hypothetical protein